MIWKGKVTMSETQKGMESLQSEGRKFPPPAAIQSNAWVDSMEQYETMWKQSIDDPDGFWLEQAKSLTWFKEPTQSLDYTWDTKARKIEHSMFPTIAWTAILAHRSKTRPPSYGKVKPKTLSRSSPTKNCTPKSANLPMS
jgi:hypothetical protein